MVVELALERKTRTSPTAQEAVSVSEVSAVPVAESRPPTTVIAI
jgi:hypothetical protein